MFQRPAAKVPAAAVSGRELSEVSQCALVETALLDDSALVPCTAALGYGRTSGASFRVPSPLPLLGTTL